MKACKARVRSVYLACVSSRLLYAAPSHIDCIIWRELVGQAAREVVDKGLRDRAGVRLGILCPIDYGIMLLMPRIPQPDEQFTEDSMHETGSLRTHLGRCVDGEEGRGVVARAGAHVDDRAALAAEAQRNSTDPSASPLTHFRKWTGDDCIELVIDSDLAHHPTETIARQ
jgi:hypothetical protein